LGLFGRTLIFERGHTLSPQKAFQNELSFTASKWAAAARVRASMA
jgi:hypothetical protein